MVSPLLFNRFDLTMDANGARHLRRRLESQEHWRQADAVKRGEQSATDPEEQDLEELGEGIRRYRVGAYAPQRLCKRLVEGRWESSLEVD